MRHIILLKFMFFYVVLLNAQNNFYNVDYRTYNLQLSLHGASKLAILPLKCLHQEYPNKTGHVSFSNVDHVMTPSQLHPAFYGCFDWHSCVHGHWMLVSLLKDFQTLPEAKLIRDAINKNINFENIEKEIAYFQLPLSKNYERTYGWAWLLKLQQELITWNDVDGKQWSNILKPLCDTIISKWMDFLPKQTYANRTGVHSNTAFGLVLALDYARAAGNKKFEQKIIQSALYLYANDKNAPVTWEPNGADFLSPSLIEADLMRRVLSRDDFIKWFDTFFPQGSLEHLTQLPYVSDRLDYQIVHLDGLCFSRSWCMRGIASVLSQNDSRKDILMNSALEHLDNGLQHITEGGYGGEHWLASFAIYALKEQ